MRKAVLIVLVLALTGCSVDTKYQTTDVDVERAFNAARDPWAAPESLTFPTGQYGEMAVLRGVGLRTTHYPGIGAREIAHLEIEAALAAGWTLASVSCGEDPRFGATLTKGGGDLDSAVVAGLGVNAGSSDVGVSVPHHLDGSWPSTTPVAIEETCLDGGPKNEPPTKFPTTPYPGDDSSPSLDDFEPWQRDSLSDAEKKLADRVAADPLLREIGAEVYVPEFWSGDSVRSGVSTGGVATSTADSTRASVSDVLLRSGWISTWVSCGDNLPTSASARLPIKDATVVARLKSSKPGKVDVAVSIGVAEAPRSWPMVDDVSALEDSRCLSTGDLPPGLTLEGVPVAVPNDLHPYLG